MVKLTFHITPVAYDLLCNIRTNGVAEYRDTEYESLESFKNSFEFIEGLKTEQWFLNRNFNGTYYLIDELTKYNLIDIDTDYWHVTYRLTEFGHEILKD